MEIIKIYRDFKDITASDKALHDRVFNTAKNPIYDGYQRGLASMIYDLFDKNSASSGAVIENQRPLD